MADPTLSVLLDRLVAERRSGATFDEAWPAAVAIALGGVSGLELDEWQAALSGTRLAWQASYCRWPQRRVERALVAVAEDPEREPVVGDSDCPVCGEPVSPGRRGRRRTYCGPVCQRAAHGRTLSAAA